MRLIALAIAAALAMFAAAKPRYLIQTWDINQGLPQGSVLAIAQTRDRYLWLGTFGGLARFDGLHFTTFDSGATPGLPSNRIVALCADPSGALWIGTAEAGLVRYKDGAFRSYVESDGLPSNKVRALLADRSGDIWIATLKGLARRSAERFESFPSPVDILALAETSDSRLLIGTSKGITAFENGGLAPYFDAGEPVLAVHQDRHGVIWFGSGKVLYRLEDGKKQPTPVVGEVRQIIEDHTGTLWVATSAGLWRAVAGGWDHYQSSDGLSDDWTRSLVEDSEGNLWAGTNSRGLNRLKQGSVSTAGTGVGLPTENTVPVLEDRDGAIWFGLTCGGLVKLKRGQYRRYLEKETQGGNCVWSLWQDREGSIWAGTRHGITRIGKDGSRTYTRENSALSDNWVTAIYQDRSGAMWFGTGDGLNRFDGATFKTYRQKNGLADDDVRFITEDPSGDLWFGTTGGVSSLHEGRFTTYTKKNGLPHDYVRAIHFSPGGAVFVGTYGGGLARLKDGKFTSFNTANGLAENIVSRILPDERGNLWLSGNHGIHRVSIADLDQFADGRATSYTVVSYGSADGMKSAECNGGGSPAGCKARDGRLYFPTQNGLAVMTPGDTGSNAGAPVVWIESALVNRKDVVPRDRVEIPAGASDLEIRYTGLKFSAPEKVVFRYRLAGLEDTWITAGARRAAYYTHLPPGRYRFTVAASNGDGVWSDSGASLDVVVLPHFWQTWWFRVSGLSLLLGASGYFYRRRIRRAENAVAQQTAYSRALIASQENERQRIAAELHDSLGQTLAIIKNRAMMSLQEPENQLRAMEQLDEIAEAAAHALHEVREIAYDLRPFQIDRLGLRASIETMVARAAGASPVRFTVDVENCDSALPDGAFIHVYRIVQEGISNVLKHSGATEAAIRVSRLDENVEIAVTDNGKGFDTENMGSDGFGMNGMAERALILGGRLNVQSTPGRGTIIRVFIPRVNSVGR